MRLLTLLAVFLLAFTFAGCDSGSHESDEFCLFNPDLCDDHEDIRPAPQDEPSAKADAPDRLEARR